MRAAAESARRAGSESVRVIGWVLASAQALHVGGDVTHLLRCQALGDIEHNDAVRGCGSGSRTAVPTVVGVVLQLRYHIDRLLRLECRITRRGIAAAERPMASDAARNAVRRIAVK